MSNVKIVTDSTAYIPSDMVAKYDIQVVPLYVLFGETSYAEGVDITNEEFYDKLKSSKSFPTTSQPPLAEFLKPYTELTNSGHQVLSIHISGKLSSTVESAMSARKELPDSQIEVVDSLLTAMALGMVALSAGKAADDGQPLTEIKEHVEQLAKRVNIMFVVDTLEYLRKGGRIGGATALLGTMLNIKPILCIKHGRIEPLARVRSKPKAVERLLELMGQRIPAGGPVHIAIHHAQALDEAMVLEKQVRSRFNCRDVYFSEIGPVIGAHVGPGTVGVAFYTDQGFAPLPVAETWQPGTIVAPA